MNVNDKNILTMKLRGRGNWRKSCSKVKSIQLGAMGASSKKKPVKYNCAGTSATMSSSNINWKTQGSKKNKTLNSSTLQTSTSNTRSDVNDDESHVIVALSEGRGDATCEVGLAAINVAEPNVILCQMPDLQSYIHTITKLNILNPVEILIPMTFVTANRLTEIIKGKFPNVKITAVSRTWYNNTSGFQSLSELCATHWKSTLLKVKQKFYTLTAFNALVTYLLMEMSISYGKETLKVDFQVPDGYAIIDISTANNLELVSSRRNITERYSSLMGVLNHCKTKMGARLLRATILQPPAQVDEINSRLDCVQELMDNPGLLTTIQESLFKLSSIHQLLSISILTHPTTTATSVQPPSTSQRHLNYLLTLNSLLQQSVALREALTPCQHDYLVTLRSLLQLPVIEDLRGLVGTLLCEDTVKSSGGGVARVGAEYCAFVIKPGVCALLDVVRTSYTDKIQAMREYVKSLCDKHGLTITLNNTTKKGYHMVMQINKNQRMGFKKSSLPQEFIQVDRLLGSVTMKTAELINLSDRAEDILFEIIKLSNIVLSKTLADIRKHSDVFFVICEYVAKIDTMQSLAEASSVGQTTRPCFGAYTQVVESRHPLLCYLRPQEPIANDIVKHASKWYNLNIITGANGSGKSIYIRQVILLQVMAQVGCFVPAKSAIFRVADRILARVTLNDDMENHASAFVLEMKEIDYFVTVLTDNTLIVIDELGRSTSMEMGTAIALAICKKLLSTKAFTFVTTHYTLLPKIQKMYLNCKNWHMQTVETDRLIDNKYKTFHFTYTLKPGVVTLKGYGIYFARICWPKRVIEEVEHVMAEDEQRWEDQLPDVEAVHPLIRIKYDCESDLQLLPRKTPETIRERLLKYQDDINDYFSQESEIPTLVELSICKDTTADDEEMAAKLQPELVYEDTSANNNSSTLQDESTRDGAEENVGEASRSSRLIEESNSSSIVVKGKSNLSGGELSDGSTSSQILQSESARYGDMKNVGDVSANSRWSIDSSSISKGNSNNLPARQLLSTSSQIVQEDLGNLEKTRSSQRNIVSKSNTSSSLNWGLNTTKSKSNSAVNVPCNANNSLKSKGQQSCNGSSPAKLARYSTHKSFDAVELESIRSELESCREELLSAWDEADDLENRTLDTRKKKSFDDLEMESIRSELESCREEFSLAWDHEEQNNREVNDLADFVSNNILHEFLVQNNDEAATSQHLADEAKSISYSPKLDGKNIEETLGETLEFEHCDAEVQQENGDFVEANVMQTENIQPYRQEMYENFEQQNILQYIMSSQNCYEDYEDALSNKSQNQFDRFNFATREVDQNNDEEEVLFSARIGQDMRSQVEEESLINNALVNQDLVTQLQHSNSDYQDCANDFATIRQKSEQVANASTIGEVLLEESVSSNYQSVLANTSAFKNPLSVIGGSSSSRFRSPINTSSSNLFAATPLKGDYVGTIKKRSKFVAPFKNNVCESEQLEPNERKSSIRLKPPRRLTRKEIEEDFLQQDMRLMESGAQTDRDIFTNRPSVRQLQEMTCVVQFDDSGQPVFNEDAYSVSEKNRSNKRNKRFTTPLKFGRGSKSLYDSFRNSLKQDSSTSGGQYDGGNPLEKDVRPNINLFATGNYFGATSACASAYLECIEQDAYNKNNTASTEEIIKKYL